MPNPILFGNELEIFGNSNAICKFDNLKLSPITLKHRLHAVWTITLLLEKILFLVVKINYNSIEID
jgi:hypothetical protein